MDSALYAKMNASLLAAYGEDGTYTGPDGGDSVPVTVIVAREGQESDGGVNRLKAMVLFDESEASPQYNGTIALTESGETWKLVRPAGSVGGMVEWEAHESVKPTYSQPRSAFRA